MFLFIPARLCDCGAILSDIDRGVCRAGVWFNSEATFYPSNVASTEVIDRHTPNSEVCMANDYSSMVFDERVFVSFNP